MTKLNFEVVHLRSSVMNMNSSTVVTKKMRAPRFFFIGKIVGEAPHLEFFFIKRRVKNNGKSLGTIQEVQHQAKD